MEIVMPREDVALLKAIKERQRHVPIVKHQSLHYKTIDRLVKIINDTS